MSEMLYKGLAAPLKMDAEEWIASLKDDGGEWLPEDKIAKLVVAKFTEAATAATEAAREKSYKNGQSEMTKKFSKLIKSSGFENPDNLTGDDLFEAFAAWKAGGAGDPTPNATPLDQWTREDLEKLPIVKSLKLEAAQAGAQRYEALKKDFEAKQTEFEQFKSSIEESTLRSKGLERFRAAAIKSGIVLVPDGTNVDPEVRLEMAYEYFIKREKIGFRDGKLTILDSDGEPKTDPAAFGKPVDFDEVAVMYAEKGLGIAAQNPNHSGSGVQQPVNGKPGAYTPTMRFNNEKEYSEYVMGETDPAKRAEAARSWQYLQSKAAGN